MVAHLKPKIKRIKHEKNIDKKEKVLGESAGRRMILVSRSHMMAAKSH